MTSLDLTQVLLMPWVIPIGVGGAVAMFAIGGGILSNCIARVTEAGLKRSMVEQGFSAHEIERVICCVPGETPSKPRPAKTSFT